MATSCLWCPLLALFAQIIFASAQLKLRTGAFSCLDWILDGLLSSSNQNQKIRGTHFGQNYLLFKIFYCPLINT